MPIEFNCHVCGKLLRTADDKAGRTAKCPGCGESVMVPQTEAAAGDESAEQEFDDDEFKDYEAGREADEFGEEDEFASMPAPGDRMRPCPMCGESISVRERRCSYCGEEIRPAGGAGPREVEVGEVISTSWEIFKSQMGVCVGAYVIMMVITMIVGGIRGFVTQIVAIAVAGAGGNQQQPDIGAMAIIFGVALFFFLIEFGVGQFLRAGMQLLLLRVVRGKNAEISDLFGAGPFFLRYLGNSILFFLMVGFGTFALIVPGIILSLMFWPYTYLLLDRDLRGVDCLSQAKELTRGNWGSIFVLALAAFGINVLGVLACCVGVVFTAPLTMMMFAVAYCRMAGRSTVRV